MGVVAGCLLKAGELSQTTRERAPRLAVLRPGVLGSPCQCVTRQLPISSHATRSRGTCTSLVGFDFAITIALRHIIIVLTMPMSDTLCTTYLSTIPRQTLDDRIGPHIVCGEAAASAVRYSAACRRTKEAFPSTKSRPLRLISCLCF
jgi:hypothetical protein